MLLADRHELKEGSNVIATHARASGKYRTCRSLGKSGDLWRYAWSRQRRAGEAPESTEDNSIRMVLNDSDSEMLCSREEKLDGI